MRTCFETEAEMAYYRCLTLVYSFTGILWLVIRIQRALVSCEKIRIGRQKLKYNYILKKHPVSLSSSASASDAIKWPHLRDLLLPRVDKSGVSVLIGQDVPEGLWPLELRKGQEGQPYAIRTR